MRLLNFLRRQKEAYFGFDSNAHLLHITLDSNAIKNNINEVKKVFPLQKIGAVLKSNAYGHGLREMGIFLDKIKDVDYFFVDSLYEARALRDFGIKKQIIILGHVPFASLKTLGNFKNIILIVNTIEDALQIAGVVGNALTVHIKIDTGMRRQGMPAHELNKCIDILQTNKKITVAGLATHLADADSQNPEPSLKQINEWENAKIIFNKRIPNGMFHFSATAGLKYVENSANNIVRLGIGLYGFNPSKDARFNFKPILSFWAKVVNIKELKINEQVGYNFTHTAPNNTTIAVIPCGYYEGVSRALSSKGHFYFKGTPLPIIGRVSMNMTTVEIGAVKEKIKIEDEIEVFSKNPAQLNSVEKVAEICNTIPYEILTGIPYGIKRIIV